MIRDPYELNEYDAEILADARRAGRSRGDWTIPFVSTVVILGVIGGLFYYHRLQQHVPVEAAPREVMTPPDEPASKAEPDIRYPIQRAEPARPNPLPPLHKSDPQLRAALTDIVGADIANRLMNLDSIVRRIIVTTDNLTRDKIPQRYSLAKPVERSFLVNGREEFTIRPENYRRYAPYVKLLESIDTKRLVSTYVYFYPLLQEEYKNIGSPKKYYNDRLVEAIDELLAAPEIKEPIHLVQPKVFYEFADPALEQLSAGQKLMIRMGPENAARVKAKLREVRRELVAIR